VQSENERLLDEARPNLVLVETLFFSFMIADDFFIAGKISPSARLSQLQRLRSSSEIFAFADCQSLLGNSYAVAGKGISLLFVVFR
jgi:hypothetical protein